MVMSASMLRQASIDWLVVARRRAAASGASNSAWTPGCPGGIPTQKERLAFRFFPLGFLIARKNLVALGEEEGGGWEGSDLAAPDEGSTVVQTFFFEGNLLPGRRGDRPVPPC